MTRAAAILVLSSSLLVACGGSDQGTAGKAAAATPPLPVPLTPAGFKVEWGLPGVPAALPAGARVPVSVEVKNVGNQAWMDAANSPGGAHAVRLGYRWWNASTPPQPIADFGTERGELHRMVTPGSTAIGTVVVTAPATPGQYLLQLDLVQELVAWFERRGAAKLLVPVTVQ